MSGKKFKKFTILHSNDMHGDFLAESQGAEGDLIGGLALLSGYLNKIGIITEKVLSSLKLDSDVGTFIGLEEASTAVEKICNAYRNEDIDLTILLTHIGFDSDKELAAMLNPDLGVDMIIGGHSHTILE